MHPSPPLTTSAKRLHTTQLSLAEGRHTVGPLPSCGEDRHNYKKPAAFTEPSDRQLSWGLRKQLVRGRTDGSRNARRCREPGVPEKNMACRMRPSDAAKMRDKLIFFSVDTYLIYVVMKQNTFFASWSCLHLNQKVSSSYFSYYYMASTFSTKDRKSTGDAILRLPAQILCQN